MTIIAGRMFSDAKRASLIAPFSKALAETFNNSDLNKATALLSKSKQIGILDGVVQKLETENNLKVLAMPPEEITDQSERREMGKIMARNFRDAVNAAKSRDVVKVLSQARSQGSLNAMTEELVSKLPPERSR